jgi:hypothetical protein
MTLSRRVVLAGLAIGGFALALGTHVLASTNARRSAVTGAQEPSMAAWSLAHGTPLFTAAGRDVGAQPMRAPTGSATNRDAGNDGVVALPNDEFVVVDISHGRWLRVDARGRLAPLPGSGQLPKDADAVAAAPDGSLLVAAEGGVVRLSPDGRLTTVLAGGSAPQGSDISVGGLAVRADGGTLIADWRNNRVLLVRDGSASTVAGNGAGDRPTGDGGPAVAAGVPEPASVSVFTDNSFLIAEGRFEQSLIRRVDSEGRIFTVAGGGKLDTEKGCVKAGTPAHALQLDRPSTVALLDRSFLIVLRNAIYRVGLDGRAAPITCMPADASASGRDLYFDGASALRADLGSLGSRGGAAVTSDGGLLIATSGHVALVPPRGGGHRLAAALPAVNLQRVPMRRVVVALPHPADVKVTVRRRDGRTNATLQAPLAAGRHQLRLPHKLGRGEYRLTLVARTGDGRVAIDRLAVLGRHELDLGVVRRALDGYPWGEDQLGAPDCHRRSLVRASCRVTEYDVCCAIGHTTLSVRLRRDGLIEAQTPERERFVLDID